MLSLSNVSQLLFEVLILKRLWTSFDYEEITNMIFTLAIVMLKTPRCENGSNNFLHLFNTFMTEFSIILKRLHWFCRENQWNGWFLHDRDLHHEELKKCCFKTAKQCYSRNQLTNIGQTNYYLWDLSKVNSVLSEFSRERLELNKLNLRI